MIAVILLTANKNPALSVICAASSAQATPADPDHRLHRLEGDAATIALEDRVGASAETRASAFEAQRTWPDFPSVRPGRK